MQWKTVMTSRVGFPMHACTLAWFHNYGLCTCAHGVSMDWWALREVYKVQPQVTGAWCPKVI